MKVKEGGNKGYTESNRGVAKNEKVNDYFQANPPKKSGKTFIVTWHFIQIDF